MLIFDRFVSPAQRPAFWPTFHNHCIMDSTRARSHIYVGFVYRSYLRNICTPPSHYRYTTKIANKPALCIPNSPIGKRYSTWKYREKIYNDYEDCIIWYNSKSKPQRRSDTIVTRTRTRYQIRTQIYLQPTLPLPRLLNDFPSSVIRPIGVGSSKFSY